MRRLTVMECVRLFSDVMIIKSVPTGGVGDGMDIDLEGSNSRMSSHHLSLPALTERLQQFARIQAPPMFDACLPPSDENSCSKWKQSFPRNILFSMMSIWKINKDDKNKLVFYTPNRRWGRPGMFTGLQFYDAVIPGPPPNVPLVLASGLLIKMRVLALASRANVLDNAPRAETIVWRKLESF